MANFTIADVLAWARTKHPSEGYDYGDNDNCALCQFLRETGRASEPSVGGLTWSEWRGKSLLYSRPIPIPLNTALIGATFGNLVQRIEALCPEAIVTPSEWTRLDAYMVDAETVSA